MQTAGKIPAVFFVEQGVWRQEIEVDGTRKRKRKTQEITEEVQHAKTIYYIMERR